MCRGPGRVQALRGFHRLTFAPPLTKGTLRRAATVRACDQLRLRDLAATVTLVALRCVPTNPVHALRPNQPVALALRASDLREVPLKLDTSFALTARALALTDATNA